MSAAPFDLVFSNAALHGVANHAEVMPRRLQQVRSQGALGIQMPAHFRSPLVHYLICWRSPGSPLGSTTCTRRFTLITVEGPAFYYDPLQPHASKLDLWETEYIHLMGGAAAILE